MDTLMFGASPGVQTMYVEFGRLRSPVAWSEGRLLGDEEISAREEVQRAFARIIADAVLDQRTPDLRAVRAGDLLLVETRVDDGSADTRIDASFVITRPARTDWGNAARQVTQVLRDCDVEVDADRLRASFDRAWQQTRPARWRGTWLAAAAFVVLAWRFVATWRTRRVAKRSLRGDR